MPDTTVKQYLESMRILVEASGKAHKRKVELGWRWSCVDDLVLCEGKQFTYAPKPKDVKYGKIKECFRNAFYLAEKRPDLTYVEGYANSIIPVWHGWCVTADGTVVDPTWRPIERENRDYFGIPFGLKFLYRRMCETKQFGILYGMPPIFVIDPAEFRERL